MRPPPPTMALAATLLCGACTTDPLSDREWSALHELTLPAELDQTEPVDNPVVGDPAAIELGWRLFFDEGYARRTDGVTPSALSCNDCHNLAKGGADPRDDGPTSYGAGWTGRNSPSVFNVGHRTAWAWDGSAETMWRQNQVPILSGAVANTTPEAFGRHVLETWPDAYAAAFPEHDPYAPPVDMGGVFDNGARALEAYLRRMVRTDAPFDRWLAGDDDALSPEAVRGAQLFVGAAACDECHRGPTLSDHAFHNIGVQQADDTAWDVGRGALEPDAEGAFLTPPLRDVALTAPYMHDGSLGDLREVVEHYRYGGHASGFPGQLDRRIQPLNLDDDDVLDLVAFLESLTGVPVACETDPALLCPPDAVDVDCGCPD